MNTKEDDLLITDEDAELVITQKPEMGKPSEEGEKEHAIEDQKS